MSSNVRSFVFSAALVMGAAVPLAAAVPVAASSVACTVYCEITPPIPVSVRNVFIGRSAALGSGEGVLHEANRTIEGIASNLSTPLVKALRLAADDGIRVTFELEGVSAHSARANLLRKAGVHLIFLRILGNANFLVVDGRTGYLTNGVFLESGTSVKVSGLVAEELARALQNATSPSHVHSDGVIAGENVTTLSDEIHHAKSSLDISTPALTDPSLLRTIAWVARTVTITVVLPESQRGGARDLSRLGVHVRFVPSVVGTTIVRDRTLAIVLSGALNQTDLSRAYEAGLVVSGRAAVSDIRYALFH